MGAAAAGAEEGGAGAAEDGAAADPVRRAAVRHRPRAQHPVPHRPGPAPGPCPAPPHPYVNVLVAFLLPPRRASTPDDGTPDFFAYPPSMSMPLCVGILL